MKGRVKWRSRAERDLKKLDPEIAKKIKDKVKKHLATNPTVNGYPLWGKWEGFWGYHIEDHRAIYEIVLEKEQEEVWVAKVGKRNPGQSDDVYGGYHPRPTANKQTITERQTDRNQARNETIGDRGKKKGG